MPGQRYRIKTPTLAIRAHDGQNTPITIAPGSRNSERTLGRKPAAGCPMGRQSRDDVHRGHSWARWAATHGYGTM